MSVERLAITACINCQMTVMRERRAVVFALLVRAVPDVWAGLPICDTARFVNKIVEPSVLIPANEAIDTNFTTSRISDSPLASPQSRQLTSDTPKHSILIQIRFLRRTTVNAYITIFLLDLRLHPEESESWPH